MSKQMMRDLQKACPKCEHPMLNHVGGMRHCISEHPTLPNDTAVECGCGYPTHYNPLDVMFAMQYQLQTMYAGVAKGKMMLVNNSFSPLEPGQLVPHSDEECVNVTQGINYWMKCIMHEAVETADWTPWKTWSQQLGNKQDIEQWSPEHMKELRVELVDIWHFLMNAMMIVGMTPDDLFKMYVEKNQINWERQGSGNY